MSPTVYRATATRDGRWWAVEIHGFPPNYAAVTQGRDLAEAEANARKATALLLDVRASEVEIDLHVNEADELIAEVERARTRRAEAAREEQATLVRAARRLVEQGMTQRDAARLLGLSFQRVHQLLKAPTPTA
jgi:predicted RNase H-like HicB family nuclease